MTHAHLVGIGGSGLSAIGRLLIEKGYQVSGSDIEMSQYALELENLGARVFTGHEAGQIEHADFVLKSSAIPEDNVEVLAAVEQGIPVYKRSEFLGSITADYVCVAIAGTHGKTTTTAMTSWMLTFLDQDPSYLIGGKSQNLASNAHAGEGSAFVIEADEYDHMFLGLKPQIAVITNIEHDHPDCFPTEEDFYASFVRFADQVQANGMIIASSEDRLSVKLIDYADKNLSVSTQTFGFERTGNVLFPDYQILNQRLNQAGGYDFDVFHGQKFLAGITLQVPGEHNMLNATASLAVAHSLELPVEGAAEALNEFSGTERRFELVGEVSGITVIDDYAHHPTEIAATLQAARVRFPDREIWAVWQPHTYSRTQALLEDYLTAFEAADHVLVTEVFASREAIRKDFSSAQVVGSMQHEDVRYFENNSSVSDHLLANLHSGAVVLVLSAGDANQISKQVVEKLSANSNEAVQLDKHA